MRDIERLDRFYSRLRTIHAENFPDWRFGQLIMNFVAWRGDIFYLEEDKMIELLEEYAYYAGERE